MYQINVYDSEAEHSTGGTVMVGKRDQGDTLLELHVSDEGFERDATVLLDVDQATRLMAQLGAFIASHS